MANKRMINGDTFEDDSDLIVLCATCHSKFHDVEIQEDDDDVQDSGIKF